MMAYDSIGPPLFILAPMDDVTDTAFRQTISHCYPPDLCFCEFVNVDGLMSPGRNRLLPKLLRADNEPPLVAHIWGLNPDNFYQVGQQIASGELAQEIGLKDNFAGIDLNMGCPTRQVVQNGACSALINDKPLAGQIIQAVRQATAGRLPISVKTRIGYDDVDPVWSRFLFEQELDMVTFHVRTRKDMSKVPAQWTEFVRLKQERDELAPHTLLIGNGDILNRQQGLDLIASYGLDGVMIGRGVFHDPFAFSPDSPWPKFSAVQKLELFAWHLQRIKDSGGNPDLQVKRLNKYAKIYVCDFVGAKELREQIARQTNFDDLVKLVNESGQNLRLA